MKLDVLKAGEKEPWYADGLQFTCTQCGNCCTGGPGYVWLSPMEVARLAVYLNLTPQETIDTHCRWIDGRVSLNEHRNSRGEYDCTFLKEFKGTPDKNGVVQTKRGCSIYDVRPLQCRTWPFWTGNLSSEKSWARASKGCHGMNRGRKFVISEIDALENAADWPDKPPTSGT